MSNLTTNEFEQLVALEEMLAELSLEARRIADESGLSRRAIAERMGQSSASTVQRLVSGAAYNSTVETLSRFAWACGFELKVALVSKAVLQEAPKAGSTTAPDEVFALEPYRKAKSRGGTSGGWANVTAGMHASHTGAPPAASPTSCPKQHPLAA
jgi:hypothetical protein